MVIQSHAICGLKSLESVRIIQNSLYLTFNLLVLGVIQYGIHHHLREAEKLLVLCHKVSLTVNLAQYNVMFILYDCDHALASITMLQLLRLFPAMLFRLFFQP